MQGAAFDRLVLDRWFRGRIGITANSVGKWGFVFFAMFVLLVEIPRGVSFKILLASLFVARELGSLPGPASFQGEVELGLHCRSNRHGVDAFRMEQCRTALVEFLPMDSELGVVLASLVFGGGCMERETARLADRPTRLRFSGRETW